jgi:hypothetical protein
VIKAFPFTGHSTVNNIAVVDRLVRHTPPAVDKQSTHSASQRKLVAFVKALYVFPIEALVSDLHPSAKSSNCRKLLNHEPDCLGGGVKTTTNGARTCPTLALCHE